MKSLKVFYYLSAILALSTISLSQEDWISLHNSNQWNNELYAIKEISVGNAVVVGNEGIILKIMKYGESITKVESNKESTLQALSFVDDSTGWTVGQNSTILKTTDSGITWMDQTIIGDFDFCSVSFVDSNKGWIIANQGSLLKTTDGGKNWITLNFSDWLLFSIQFIDSLNGWISSSNYISKTTDGGNSWTKYTTNVTTRSLFFLTPEKGWAVGSYGVIYKTTDGGNTWVQKPNQVSASRLLSVVFNSEITGYSVGEDGIAIKTNDGGETWQDLLVPGGYSISSGYSNSVWISGSSGLILNSKDGKNWNILSSMYLSQKGIFYNSQIGWVYGNSQYIYKTIDGGNNWTIRKIGLNKYEALFSVNFIDSINGYASSNRGIYKSNDGGENWQKIFNNQSGDYPYKFVQMIDTMMGFGIGSYGKIFKTNNGGTNWELVYTAPANVEFNSLFVLNSNIIWAAGGDNNLSSSTIVKTIDKGLTWSIQNFNNYPQLNSIFFIDKKNGYAVGNNGTIIYTNDEGASWYLQNSNIIENLRSVYFVNQQYGWTVGDNSKIIYTTDSGNLWQEIENSLSSNFNSVQFTEDAGYIIGTNGIILKDTLVTGIKHVNDNPKLYLLSQNYPNPFNPSTTIEFSVPQQSFVKLKVYDLLGKEVATLVNEEKATGNYR